MQYIERHERTQYLLAIILLDSSELLLSLRYLFIFLPLLFFKGIFHLVHSGLNSIPLGHIVLTMASQSQHVLAQLSLSELIFSSRSLCSSCPSRLSALGMCQAICFLRVFAFAFLYV